MQLESLEKRFDWSTVNDQRRRTHCFLRAALWRIGFAMATFRLRADGCSSRGGSVSESVAVLPVDLLALFAQFDLQEVCNLVYWCGPRRTFDTHAVSGNKRESSESVIDDARISKFRIRTSKAKSKTGCGRNVPQTPARARAENDISCLTADCK